jgi:hypothetical protein
MYWRQWRQPLATVPHRRKSLFPTKRKIGREASRYSRYDPTHKSHAPKKPVPVPLKLSPAAKISPAVVLLSKKEYYVIKSSQHF